ncbi:MAG: Rid family hydrolase [Smithella sp.]|nr:Rid family hydrolase [Smithella sp.]
MSKDLIVHGDGFHIEFHTKNHMTSPERFPPLCAEISGDNDYVLQERIIVPPDMANMAGRYSSMTSTPDRCNSPLILKGHPDLPFQRASVVARIEDAASKADKSDHAIKITSGESSVLYGAPIFGLTGSFHAAFKKISDVLENVQMNESDMVRTWIFMDDILKDYDELNTAREKFFSQWHGQDKTFIPASTGIQSRTIGHNRLAIEFCAFSGKNISIRQISSPLQNEPTAYGKLFSRAVLVELIRSKLLFISGTAAIDKAGRSVYAGNFEKQLKFTLDVLTEILGQQNAGFSSIAQAIVYLKRSEDLRSGMNILEKTAFPCEKSLFQIGVDVCRDDLLCEIEVTAVI